MPVSSDNLLLLSLQLLTHLFLFTTGIILSSQNVIAQKVKRDFLRQFFEAGETARKKHEIKPLRKKSW